jgi:hypothetical protein
MRFASEHGLDDEYDEQEGARYACEAADPDGLCLEVVQCFDCWTCRRHCGCRPGQ